MIVNIDNIVTAVEPKEVLGIDFDRYQLVLAIRAFAGDSFGSKDNMKKFLKIMKIPGLRNVKNIEMGTKYRKLLPEKYLDYSLYQVPPKKMIDKHNATKRATKKQKLWLLH